MTYKTYRTNKTYKNGEKPRLIPPHGGYKKLLSYQMAAIICDLTVIFTDKYIDKFSRTKDQMVQAARSGKQNIAEGSQVSGTSKKTELKLVGVARASLAELLDDCEDFLRQREFKQWGKDFAKAREVRGLAYRSNKSYKTYRTYMSDPESAANCLICLINQANYLLDKQLKALEKEFLKEGGFTERLYRKRREYRWYKSYKSNKTYGSNKGAALLELVFVMALLVVVLVALVSLAVVSLSTVQKSRLRARATAIAEQGIENVRAKRDEYLNSNIKTWDNFKDDCKSSISSVDWSGSFDDENGTFDRVETCVDAPADKVKVTMTVNWIFGKTPSNVILETEFGKKKDSIFR